MSSLILNVVQEFLQATKYLRRVDWYHRNQHREINWEALVFADESQIQLHRKTVEIRRNRNSAQKSPEPSKSPRISV